MSAGQINIAADTQDLANALTVAVNQGLAAAGFTNVLSTTDVPEPDNLLAALRAKAPEVFTQDIEVVTATIEPQEEVDDTSSDVVVDAELA